MNKRPRSGYCLGGLTSQEVERTLELQRENLDLMMKLSSVTLRRNQHMYDSKDS